MANEKCEVRILDDAGELCREAAREFTRLAEQAVSRSDMFTVALSGGSTPRSLYTFLADRNEPFRDRIPWGKIHFFWGDERHVPPDDRESNYRMVYEALFSKVPVLPGTVHRIQSEMKDAENAAREYERVLRSFFHLDEEGQWPRFDLVLLGMGPDGHTASLFPGSRTLSERKLLVDAPWVATISSHRITLTPRVFNNAATAIFLTAGEEKAAALRDVIQGKYRPDRFPAQLIRTAGGSVLWLVDRAAASLLDSGRGKPPR